MKICTKCHIEKSLNEFHPRKPSGHHSWCKVCYNQRYRDRYAQFEATGTASVHYKATISDKQATISSTSSVDVCVADG